MSTPNPPRRRGDEPLSARQLVIILIIAGLLVWTVLSEVHNFQQTDRAEQRGDCILAGGPDCQNHPGVYVH